MQTFKHLAWLPAWIAVAEEGFQRINQDQYAPPSISTPSSPPPISSQSSLDDDFMTAMFGSSQMSDSQLMISEIDIYLEEKVENP